MALYIEQKKDVMLEFQIISESILSLAITNLFYIIFAFFSNW